MQTESVLNSDKALEEFRPNPAQTDRQTGFKYPPTLKWNKMEEKLKCNDEHMVLIKSQGKHHSMRTKSANI